MNPPVIVGVKADQIPDGIIHAHHTAEKGLADNYNHCTTGGVIVRFDVLECEQNQYPELIGIETIWLIYRGGTQIDL